MTIRSKLILIFVSLVILPAILGGAVMFTYMRGVVRDVRLYQLENIASQQKDRFEAFFDERRGDAEYFQTFDVIKDNIDVIKSHPASHNAPEYQKAVREVEKQLGALRRIYGYSDTMLTDTKGHIICVGNPVHRSAQLGKPLSMLDPKAFEGGRKGAYFSGIYKTGTDGRSLGMLMTAPVKDNAGAFAGEVALEMDAGRVFELVKDATGLGSTGETFIGIPNGQEVLFINPFHPERNKTIPASELFSGKMKTAKPMQEALRQRGGSGESVDYLGHDVLAAWRYAPATGWGIVTKIDSSEVYAIVTKLKVQAAELGIIILLFCAAAAFAISRSITEPIKALQQGTEVIGSGNLDYKVGIQKNDEIGQLSRAIDRMAGNLKNITASRDDLDREVVERKKAEDEVRKLNEDLERRVVQRTEELTASNKELEAFSYSVSHDLRAPLRHVQGFVEMLGKNAGDKLDEKGRRYLDTISRAASQMGTLIDDLLTFSRMGRSELHLSWIDLETLFGSVIEEMREDIRGRDIAWKVGHLPKVRGDVSMLRLVAVNLLSNAVKFTGKRDIAEIEIGSRSEGEGEFVIYVKDNGVGFDMQYVDKLFGVFQRLHKAEEFDGTGIGLANIRRIISRHGGRTWAESAPGEGATVYFTLPDLK